MKGIILAAGKGSRLYPTTWVTSKQLLPIFDKPMIYYPITTLIEAGVFEILLITTKEDQKLFWSLLGDGSQWGISIEYAVQEKPRGIAEAFIIGEEFIGKDSVALILGDNLFYGHNLKETFAFATQLKTGAVVFGYEVEDPSRYGVLAIDEKGDVETIIEKPSDPPSNYAVTGLYFYDNQVVDLAKTLKPSRRGELEITDVNNLYAKQKKLKCHFLQRGFAWFDAGTPKALLEAANWVQTIQQRQGIVVGCVEEVAYSNGRIGKKELLDQIQKLLPSTYAQYLKRLL